MNYFDASILGIVEGLSEFLPISSTGHLILVSHLLGIDGDAFTKTFEIAIQLGAILSVVVLYRRKLFCDFELMKRLAVAFVPTGVIGFLLYKVVKHLLGSEAVVIASLFVGGIILILFERWHKEKSDVSSDLASMSYGTAVKLGLFQAISIIPGVSRSGATIVGGMLLGMKREAIVEFSVLLAVPTMLAATGYDLWKNAGAFHGAEWSLLGVGFVVSFLVAIVAIKFFLTFVRSHSFTSFGVYRIAVAALFFLFVLR
jgi:undecaprenyl-diphosphatase